MTSQNQEAFQASLQQELERIQRNQSIIKFVQNVFIGFIVLLPFTGVGLWYYAVELELTGVLFWIVLGLLIILELVLIPLLMLTYPIGYVISRIPNELKLQLDVTQAVAAAMLDFFVDKLASYHKIEEKIHIGAEMLRDLEYQSTRIQELRDIIAKKLPEFKESVKIAILVNQIADERELEITLEDMKKMAETFDLSNFVKTAPKN